MEKYFLFLEIKKDSWHFDKSPCEEVESMEREEEADLSLAEDLKPTKSGFDQKG